MSDVTHVRPAGDNPDGFLSGQEVERHEREMRAAQGRGWVAAPVPEDGQSHQWWPNRCDVCSVEPPEQRIERIAVDAFNSSAKTGAPTLADLRSIAATAERIQPGMATIVGQLLSVGGLEAVTMGVANLVAQWMHVAMSARNEGLEATSDLAVALTRVEDELARKTTALADLDATVVELDTAKTEGVLTVQEVGEDGDLEGVCPHCGSDDLLWEYEGRRQHQVLGPTRGPASEPLSLAAVARHTTVDAAGEETRGRVRCRACARLLALPEGMTVYYV